MDSFQLVDLSILPIEGEIGKGRHAFPDTFALN